MYGALFSFAGNRAQVMRFAMGLADFAIPVPTSTHVQVIGFALGLVDFAMPRVLLSLTRARGHSYRCGIRQVRVQALTK